MAVNETAAALGGLAEGTGIPSAFQPLIDVISKIRGAIEILVGGIFGIYLILIILRWLEYKKVVKLLTQIRKEMRELNENLTGKKKKKR